MTKKFTKKTVITKILNWVVLTNNLVTFKSWDGFKDKTL